MQLQNTPTAGQRTAHRNLKFGYFSQHHVDQLDMSVCPVELMAQHFPGKEKTVPTFGNYLQVPSLESV